MTTKNNIRRNAWMILATLLLALGIVSASGTMPISASTLSDTSPIDLVRQNMLKVAYLYANHRWTATQTNLLQSTEDSHVEHVDYPSSIFTDSSPYQLLDPISGMIKYFLGDHGSLNSDFLYNYPVITPDWIVIGENVGVPYAWGLSSGLIATQHDLEIPIDPPMQDVSIPIVPVTTDNLNFDLVSFDAKIASGLFAGNRWVGGSTPEDEITDAKRVNSWAAGVDCVGLINNA